MRLSYLSSPQWLLWAASTLSIYLSNFLYHVNQCRVQLGTNKVVVVVVAAASIHYRHYTHGYDSLFFIFPPIFEKVVKWGMIHLSFICLFV